VEVNLVENGTRLEGEKPRFVVPIALFIPDENWTSHSLIGKYF
jgi:hypothetical protein